MRVTRRWQVRDVRELRAVSGWLHDADWDDEAMRWEDDGTLVVPFAQLPTTVEECGQEAVLDDHGEPLPVRCRVVVRQVTSVAIGMEERDAPRMLCCAEHDSVARKLTFSAVVGPELHVGVERLDLTIEMSDRLVLRHDDEIGGAG